MADSKNLRAMLLRCLTILVVCAISFVALLYASLKMDQESYLVSVFDKVKLLENTSSRKIVFVGGSGLAFGLDSSKLEQAYGLPVINMGVHAGFGLKFLLEQVRPFLKQGDIVVIMPEFEHFVGNLFYGAEPLIQYLLYTQNWKGLCDLPKIHLINVLLKMNCMIFDYSPGHQAKLPYVRSGFNNYGDMTAHLDLPDVDFSKTSRLEKKLNEEAVQFLHNFVVTNTKQGISTMVIYPGMADTFYFRNADTIIAIAEAFRIHTIDVLATPQDCVYDDNLFFDSVYHLNKRGREKRTIKMIQSLANVLHNKTPAIPVNTGQ